MKVVLDTHVVLQWFGIGAAPAPRHKRILAAAGPERPLFVSEISLWEIATLAERNRIRLHLPVRDWLERATAPPLVARHGITPAVAAEVAVLPSSFHRDPADRIIVSTARVLGATLLTSDRRIIESGLVATLA